MADSSLPPGAIANQQNLTPSEQGDLLLVYRPSLGSNGVGQYAVASVLGSYQPAYFDKITLGTTGGPTVSTGTGAPTAVEPIASLYMRQDGIGGATLYISQGGGLWNAVDSRTVIQSTSETIAPEATLAPVVTRQTHREAASVGASAGIFSIALVNGA